MEAGFIVNGQYQLIKKIGKGAFSYCYLAKVLSSWDEEETKAQEVVLKIASRPSYSWFKEYSVSSELSAHNSLLRYTDYGTVTIKNEITKIEEEREFLVCEAMVNGDLLKYVSNNGFDENIARFIFKNVLLALESIHKDGYSHFDIKLSNILLDENFMPKLCDYGYTQRSTSEDMFLSKDFVCQGTKHYICSEVNEEETFSPQSADIFALGVTFFVLMIGDYPFSKAWKTDSKYQNFYRKDPFTFWKKHNRAKKKIKKGLISDDLIDLITRMLMPTKADRISIEEIKEHKWYTEPTVSSAEVKEYFESLCLSESLI